MVEKAWSNPTDEILQSLEVDRQEGLNDRELSRRRQEYGKNLLREIQKKSAWSILLEQFKSFIILLLAAAAVISYIFGDWLEGSAIVTVIFINAAIGFFTELKAVRSMEALRRLGSVQTRVRRNGKVSEVTADSLVPGDIVIIEGGDVVTADLRLFEASRLQADESALTGESVPVAKNTDVLDSGTPLAERANMLFKGTAVTRGSGEAAVVATGMNTELGRISSLVESAEDETTPLERRLDKLGHKLIWVTLALTAIIAVIGVIRGRELFLTLETSIALAVAAIPEGLPIVATIALARGMRRMAKRNALINRLSSVETLGATTVIFTDKTGTLTENRMTVSRLLIDAGEIEVDPRNGFVLDDQRIEPDDHPVLTSALQISVLCNNASLDENAENGNARGTGDPLEVALLGAAAIAGMRRENVIKTLPESREEAFDTETKMMATFHEKDDGYLVAVKGAPEAVLDASTRLLCDDGDRELDDEDRKKWAEQSKRLAARGLRMLALARKHVTDVEADPYEDLCLIGLVGLLDPPRRDVRDAIRDTRGAGIRVVMVTGDQAPTAQNIAFEVGLTDDEDTEVIEGKDLKNPDELSEEEREHIAQIPVFARVSPKQKLDLIALYHRAGAVVAMTGDGVNDAPALRKADIGVAMGQRGTQVAREAADMVLKDDAFASIVAAIDQGRVIFDNIRKFVVYLISCNVSEIASVAIASAANAPLPLLPLQILFLNLVTDVFPALALGVGTGSEDVMKRGPRPPTEGIVTKKHWGAIAGFGLLITTAVLAALAFAIEVLHVGQKEAVSISFLTLALAQLWHVFNMSYPGSGLLRNDITRNPWIWGALGLCLGLILAAVYVPVLSTILKIVPPGGNGWLLVIGASLFPLVVGRLFKGIIKI